LPTTKWLASSATAAEASHRPSKRAICWAPAGGDTPRASRAAMAD
jgi:hypothetical protein